MEAKWSTRVWAQLILLMLLPSLEGLTLDLPSLVRSCAPTLSWHGLSWRVRTVCSLLWDSRAFRLYSSTTWWLLQVGYVIPVSFLMGVGGKGWFPTHFSIFTAAWLLTRQRCLIVPACAAYILKRFLINVHWIELKWSECIEISLLECYSWRGVLLLRRNLSMFWGLFSYL